ncbi:hypothetical protein M2119_000764 [Aurantimicrobium minutum]|uniref:hypothetical protein n=1 Tax=Aurantimicrobium minutum TaxID=708131 RepID=UPI0024747345|nr:hypothetical protein [Aurantimicrobium minutum]MDH6532527.1 hypothetical protein [Aurantimicrobium minutum]
MARTPCGGTVLFAEETIDPQLVSPGVVGFVATAFVAILTVLLLLDMVRRMRKVNMRADIQEKLDAEEAAEAQAKPAQP